MRSIQDVGLEILQGNPKHFYVFVGSEYGIKCRYLDILRNHYKEYVEFQKVSDILSIMRTKQLIPLKPTLYVVRYDEEFLSGLNSSTQDYIKSTKIVGTIVCLYEDSKHATKVDKFLSDYTVYINSVSRQFVEKYLQTDFPNLPKRFISLSATGSNNYGQAKQMCLAMSNADIKELEHLSDEAVLKIFGYVEQSVESEIRKGVASRNFVYLTDVIDRYDGDIDSILYAVLSTMVELDKIFGNKYADSDIREYVKQWTRADIYYMFCHGYNELKKLRSISVDGKNRIIYLFSLLQFERIPAMEVLE